MAEIATIARPYAEALFKAAGADAPLLQQVQALADIAADPQLQQFADRPEGRTAGLQVIEVLSSVARARRCRPPVRRTCCAR
jgi:F-type H+-transporting ATPase subunit delta